MSRARKIKKADKYHEYEVTDRHGELVIWFGGYVTPRAARRNRMWDVSYVRDDIREPARGVKYHVPRNSFYRR